MTTDETIARGKRAAEILDDPLVVEALDALDAFVIDGFRGSKLGERDEREALYHLNVAIADFPGAFPLAGQRRDHGAGAFGAGCRAGGRRPSCRRISAGTQQVRAPALSSFSCPPNYRSRIPSRRTMDY
jgi:hypothetical protein